MTAVGSAPSTRSVAGSGEGSGAGRRQRTAGPLPAVRAVARYEVTRLRGLRSARVTGLLLVLWALLNGVGTGLTTRMTGEPTGRFDVVQALLGLPVLTAFTPVLAVVGLLFGAGSIGLELQHRSLRWLLVARPDRRVVLLTKAAVTSVAVVTAAVAFAVVSGAGLFLADPSAFPLVGADVGPLANTCLGYVVVLIAWTLLAVGVTAAVGTRTRALTGLVGWALVVEPLIGLAAGRVGVPEAVTRVLRPFGQSRDLLRPALDLSGTGTVDWWPALPWLALVVAAALLVGVRRLGRTSV